MHCIAMSSFYFCKTHSLVSRHLNDLLFNKRQDLRISFSETEDRCFQLKPIPRQLFHLDVHSYCRILALTMTLPTHAALLATLLTSLFFLVSALVAVGLLIEKIILWLDMLTGLEVLPLTKYVPAMVRFSNY